MSKIENRLASFKNWPTELEMKPEELAEAGFFHDPHDELADLVTIAKKLIQNYHFVKTSGSMFPMQQVGL